MFYNLQGDFAKCTKSRNCSDTDKIMALPCYQGNWKHFYIASGEPPVLCSHPFLLLS